MCMGQDTGSVHKFWVCGQWDQWILIVRDCMFSCVADNQSPKIETNIQSRTIKFVDLTVCFYSWTATVYLKTVNHCASCNYCTLSSCETVVLTFRLDVLPPSPMVSFWDALLGSMVAGSGFLGSVSCKGVSLVWGLETAGSIWCASLCRRRYAKPIVCRHTNPIAAPTPA